MTVSPKTFFVKTFGCQMNFSDSERIAGFLDSLKLKAAEEIFQADLVIFNTCGVRQSAENRVYGQVHNLRKQNKKCFIVVTGCLAHRQDVQNKLREKVNLFLPINDFFEFKNWIFENYLEIGNWKLEISARKKILKKHKNSYLDINPRYLCSQKVFVPIMTGCNNFCSYCVVPYARGREWSRPIEDILKEVDNLGKTGCQEITLLGQNVNSYKIKIDFKKLKNSKLFKNWKLKIKNSRTIAFPLLLNIFASSYPKITWCFLTSHPKDFSDELIKVIKNNKNISREIHLPIQSGSNRILKLMNRPYTQKHYLDLIKKIKKQIPGAKISTDVIVGFPGETEKDFQETVKVFKKVNFFNAYINKYSPRPGTAAFKLKDDISWEEKKRRENFLRTLIK